MKKTLKIITLIFIVLCSSLSPLTSIATKNRIKSEILLSPPLSVDVTYRDAIVKRCSIRSFNQFETVTDEELSTILWAAYGLRDDGSRTVQPVDDLHSTIIYVFRQEAAYTYNPSNHSLMLFQEGDLRQTVNWQHVAPIQLGLVWNKNITSDGNLSAVEIGEIGQNIYFMAYALGIGTVTAGLTGFDEIELPDDQVGRIVMPLGHPSQPPLLEYKPKLISLLPRLEDSEINLTTVLKNRKEGTEYSGQITRKQLGNLLWAAYGFSYYLDLTDTQTNEVQRHRTVPSAGCLYPLAIYAITEIGIFRYIPHILHLNPYSDSPLYSTNWKFPIVSFLLPIRFGNHLQEIAQASAQPDISNAPLIITVVLPNPSIYPVTWYWYYEAGASAHNIMLETTLLNLHAGIVKPTDSHAIKTLLRLRDQSLPQLIIPIGE